jgi:hypothetical protein
MARRGHLFRLPSRGRLIVKVVDGNRPGRSARRCASKRDLARDLRRRIAGEVRFEDGRRALDATDASNYRQVPIGVVLARAVDDVLEMRAVCRRQEVRP